jgi:hypothetical protein
MELSRSTVVVWQPNSRTALGLDARAGFSLHNHSCCSRESLEFLPGIARRIPFIAHRFEAGLARHVTSRGHQLDFQAMYWRPPLDPRAVVASERDQIERSLGLPAFVALTDHDTLLGTRSARETGEPTLPFSFEWTVRFAGSTFHLGLHNIAPRRVDEVERELIRAAPADRSEGRLRELLTWLAEDQATFVVLNHPMWDLAGAGAHVHHARVLMFLRACGPLIHALELNGYRRWSENVQVLPLAHGFDLPLVAAGDRHGCAPSTMLTAARATSFDEFAQTLRSGGPTMCLVLPEYREPFASRVLEGAGDVLRTRHDPVAGARRWADRVFFVEDGEERALSSVWPAGGPWWLEGAVSLTRLLGAQRLRPLYRLTLAPDRQ